MQSWAWLLGETQVTSALKGIKYTILLHQHNEFSAGVEARPRGCLPNCVTAGISKRCLFGPDEGSDVPAMTKFVASINSRADLLCL
jgi:hypothetical protein